jgi:hypothetical protein
MKYKKYKVSELIEKLQLEKNTYKTLLVFINSFGINDNETKIYYFLLGKQIKYLKKNYKKTEFVSYDLNKYELLTTTKKNE